MLVLSRRKGESIKIGNDITIEVTRVEGNRVKLAVSAPLDVRILRTELLDRKQGDDDGLSTDGGGEARGLGAVGD